MSELVPPTNAASTPGHPPARGNPGFRRNIWPWIAVAVLVAVAAGQLRLQGRLWWCACGQLYPWSGNVWSRHNSQHLFDPYSFTHVLHGMIFYGLLAWAFPRVGQAWRLCLGVFFEALWEVVENTDFVIQRYRAATASFDYEGDTVFNSLGDILSFALGFALAPRLGLRRSVVVFVVTEVVLLIWIRDNLLLNVLMLIYPIDAIKRWQMGQ